MTIVGCCAAAGTIGGISAASVRFMVPNVLYEPPKSYKVGRPDEYPEGVTFIADKGIFVVRKGNLFRVVSAVCTHMGCRPRWISESTRWECPCHGSVYDESGKVIGGPAPRPLPWYEVNLSADGRLFVDERRVVPFTETLTVKT